MIGAPLTGGAAAKLALGDALADSATDLPLLFAFSATGTVLLMARFMWLVARAGTPERARLTAASLAWLSLAVPAIWLPFGPGDLPLAGDGLAPLTAGLAIAATVYFTATRGPHRRWPGIPPGDIIHLLPAWRRQARTRPRSIASCAPR